MLQKEIEEETSMDKLEADIVRTVDYQDVILPLWKDCATRMIDREQATAREGNLHWWCEYTFKQTWWRFSQTWARPPVATNICLWSIVIEASKPKKAIWDSPSVNKNRGDVRWDCGPCALWLCPFCYCLSLLCSFLYSHVNETAGTERNLGERDINGDRERARAVHKHCTRWVHCRYLIGWSSLPFYVTRQSSVPHLTCSYICDITHRCDWCSLCLLYLSVFTV